MACTVFAVALLLLLAVCSTSNAHHVDSIQAIYGVLSRHPSQPSAGSASTMGASTRHHRQETTVVPAPQAGVSLVSAAWQDDPDEVAERATRFRYSVFGVGHKIRERREKELLDEGKTDVDSAEGYRDGETSETTARVLDESASAGSSGSLKAVYDLYALMSFVRAASDESKPESEPKSSSSAHINALYTLYSLVTYMMTNVEDYKTRDDKAGQISTERLASALNSNNQTNATKKELNKGESDSSEWRYYVVIAMSVLAAVAVVLVVAMCLIRHCQRGGTTYSSEVTATRPVVRGIASPVT